VRKLVGENKRFVYGIGGELIAEFDASSGSLKKEYVYGGASPITIEPTAVNSNGTRYTTADTLGSPRVITNSLAAVVSRHDLMPFGEELGSGVGGRTSAMGFGVVDGQRQKFTSYERDNETSLDYAQNRYYSPTIGRLTSVDPGNTGSIPSLPQSWNGYSYAHNRPTFYVDPDGLKVRVCDNSGKCSEISDEVAKNYLFNKDYARNNGFVTDGNGNVWNHNGEKIGTYTRTSFDDLSDEANEFLFQMMRRTAPIPRATWEFAKISVQLGTRIGISWAASDAYSILTEPTSPDHTIGTMPTDSGQLYLSQGDQNYLGFVLKSDKGEIQIFAKSVTQQGDTLMIDDLSIQGAGANTVGLSSTRQYARDIGKAFGAKEVIIQGGRRTSGANPGRTPVPIRIRVR
jgi:RHS repeat-associated protein